MRLSRYLLLLCLLCPAFAYGQGFQIRDVAQKLVNGNYQPAIGASVTVCTSAGVGIPCTPTTTIYTDIGLTSPSANPIIVGTSSNSDSLGNFFFYVSPNTSYVVTITGAGFTGRSLTYQLACPTSSSCAFVSAGVFTNTQITNTLSAFVNGVPFPYAGTGFMTAVAGGVTTPSSATAINIDGIYGTAISNCNSVGRTVCNTDGGYFSAQANANGAGVWGINPIALDVVGVANAHVTGSEIDVGNGGTSAYVRGQVIILTDGGGTIGTMPVNSIGLEILGTHTPAQQWNRGIQIDDGSASLHALQIGAVGNGTNVAGMPIAFARWDSGGVRRTTESININSVGDLLFTQTGGASTLLHGMGTGNVLTTGSGAGNLLQTKRTAGCTTSGGATPFTGPCTVTVTWPNTFADGNYTVTCTGNGIGAGVPLLQATTTITGASAIVQTQQATGVNASFNNIECTAIHD